MAHETRRRALLAVAAAMACAAEAGAQPPAGRSQFRADSNLVLVPVTVTDARGSNVQGLGKDSFTVLDDRQPQPIVAFYSDDTPASVGIVLDVSGSTAGILQREKAAVRSFLDSSNPGDDFFLATVSSQPRLLADRVTDSREIDELLLPQMAGGGTALCDSVYFALHQARLRPRSRRALLVISDGMDNHSRYSKRELLAEVLESDTQIYTIALVNRGFGAKGLTGDEIRRGLAFMDDLAEQSGGVSVRLGDFDNPAAAAARISAAMRSQYILGYRSPAGSDAARRHSIRVKVDLERASVHARTRYQLR